MEWENDPILPLRNLAIILFLFISSQLWAVAQQDLSARVIDSVAPGGVFLYETFAFGNEAFGRPKNPKFLLKAGELLEMVRGKLRVVAFGQETRRDPSPAIIQHIAAVRD